MMEEWVEERMEGSKYREVGRETLNLILVSALPSNFVTLESFIYFFFL
jgi:hypothetical protein